ncbi:MAG: hypothetical protein ABJK28_15310 [Algibacter sp.]
MIKNKQQINWIDSVGIGLFMMFSIMEFSSLLEYLLVHFFVAMGANIEMILWLPKIIGFLLVIVISVLVLNKMNTMHQVVSRKNLKTWTGIFFGIVIIQTLYNIYGSEFMYDKYSDEFDNYYSTLRGEYLLQSFLSFIPLLKYLAFGSILLLKRDEAAGKGIKGSNQISEIGES